MLDRTAAPALHDIEALSFPAPEVMTLDNGTSLVVNRADHLEVVRLEFIFRAGNWFERKPGVSFFTIKSMSDGTKKRTSNEVAGLIDSYGSFLELDHGLDYSTLSISFPVRHFKEILAIIRELLFDSVFPEQELKIRKQRRIQSLKIEEKKNNLVANKAFRELLFQSNHPYGRKLTEPKINDLEPEDLRNFYDLHIRSYYGIYLTGNVPDELIKLVQQYFGQNQQELQNSGAFFPEGEQEEKEKVITKPESVQSSVRLGNFAIARKHPDYFKLAFTTVILGGYFGSRLIQNIREDKGLTYGIYAQIINLKNNHYWMISTETKKELLETCKDEIISELRGLIQNPPTKQEITTVKNYITGSLLNSMSNPFQVTEKFKMIRLYELPSDYFDAYLDAIHRYQADDCIDMSKQYLNPDDMLSVVVT
jgi:predicted Zn-dependent peptidase